MANNTKATPAFTATPYWYNTPIEIAIEPLAIAKPTVGENC
jgi:hypothetical protein